MTDHVMADVRSMRSSPTRQLAQAVLSRAERSRLSRMRGGKPARGSAAFYPQANDYKY